MSPSSLAPGLSPRARQALSTLMDSSRSEAIGVADILNTIAENDAGCHTNVHLRVCAKAIIESAELFLRAIR